MCTFDEIDVTGAHARTGHRLTARLERPLRLANDADCFALSEAVDGAQSSSLTLRFRK